MRLSALRPSCAAACRHLHARSPAWLSALPAPLRPAGWAALVKTLGLDCPRPFAPLSTLQDGAAGAFLPPAGWRILGNGSTPSEVEDEVETNLALAMQHEGPELTVLGAALAAPGPKARIAEAVSRLVIENPSEEWRRRLWFLYEWMSGETLADLHDVPSTLPYTDVLDGAQFFTALPVPSARHRVRDNLLGCPDFSPVVRRTPELQLYSSQDFGRRAAQLLAQFGEVLTRNYSYDMVVQETVHSMFIENVSYRDFDVPRLASILMKHSNFDAMPLDEPSVKQYMLPAVLGVGEVPCNMEYRTEQAYVSETEWTVDDTKDQVLFIPAKPQDLEALMRGFFRTLQRAKSDQTTRPEGVDSVVQAACLGFGLVYIQPFEDGNGRLHRLMIQQLLGRLGFVPRMIFPVSRLMVQEREQYQKALRRFDEQCMPSIHFNLAPDGRMRVTNPTAHLYRYFDATAVAEYLYYCIQRCVEHDLPNYCNVVTQSYYRAYE